MADTLKEKLFIVGIIFLVVLSVIICVVVGKNIYNKNSTFRPNAAKASKLSDQDILKAKALYNEDGKMEEFLEIYTNISTKISEMLLDGSVTDEESLSKKVESINKVLSSNKWTSLGVELPEKWLGDWSLDENGFLKFKFQEAAIEPDWINNEEVIKYIILN